MSIAVGRWSIRTRKPSGCVVTSPPAVTTLSSAISRKRGSTPLTVTSPRVIAAPKAQVPATMRSPMVRCVTGRSSVTPSTSILEVPAPEMCAPMPVSMAQMSTISGSRAALSISVTPLASTAAISRFSVAPTLGKSSQMVAPFSPSRRGGDDEAVLAGDLRAHPGQAGHVHVQAPRADRVAARVGHPDLAAAGQQRAEHADRRPQPPDQLIVGLGARLAPGASMTSVPGPVGVHAAAKPPQHLGHDRDVGDLRDVVQDRAALGQQSGGHQLERGVLGARRLRPRRPAECHRAPGSCPRRHGRIVGSCPAPSSEGRRPAVHGSPHRGRPALGWTSWPFTSPASTPGPAMPA